MRFADLVAAFRRGDERVYLTAGGAAPEEDAEPAERASAPPPEKPRGGALFPRASAPRRAAKSGDATIALSSNSENSGTSASVAANSSRYSTYPGAPRARCLAPELT